MGSFPDTFPRWGPPQGGSFLRPQISPGLGEVTYLQHCCHPRQVPQTIPRCPAIPSCDSVPALSLRWGIFSVGASSFLPMLPGPSTKRKSISRVPSQPCYPLNVGDVLFPSLGVTSSHTFPNSLKPSTPKPPGSLLGSIPRVETVKQRLPSSPAVPNLGSFPLTSVVLQIAEAQMGGTARWQFPPP